MLADNQQPAPIQPRNNTSLEAMNAYQQRINPAQDHQMYHSIQHYPYQQPMNWQINQNFSRLLDEPQQHGYTEEFMLGFKLVEGEEASSPQQSEIGGGTFPGSKTPVAGNQGQQISMIADDEDDLQLLDTIKEMENDPKIKKAKKGPMCCGIMSKKKNPSDRVHFWHD